MTHPVPHDTVRRMQHSASATSPALRVLVVEDNWEAALTLGVLLEGWGYEVHTAHNGLEAFGMAESVRPDVVLLDIGLPKINGFELAEQIREEPWGQGMRLIVISAYGTASDKQRARNAGTDDYLVKPVDPEVLLHLLARIAGERSH